MTCTRSPRRSRRTCMATPEPPRSGPHLLHDVGRPVVEAWHDAIGVRLHPYARVPDDLKRSARVKTRHARPEIGVVVVRIDAHTPLWRVELGLVQFRKQPLRIIGAGALERARGDMNLKIGGFGSRG